jgi:hypothetical protein
MPSNLSGVEREYERALTEEVPLTTPGSRSVRVRSQAVARASLPSGAAAREAAAKEISPLPLYDVLVMRSATGYEGSRAA